MSLDSLCKLCKPVVMVGRYTLLPSAEVSDSESVSESLFKGGGKQPRVRHKSFGLHRQGCMVHANDKAEQSFILIKLSYLDRG